MSPSRKIRGRRVAGPQERLGVTGAVLELEPHHDRRVHLGQCGGDARREPLRQREDRRHGRAKREEPPATHTRVRHPVRQRPAGGRACQDVVLGFTRQHRPPPRGGAGPHIRWGDPGAPYRSIMGHLIRRNKGRKSLDRHHGRPETRKGEHPRRARRRRDQDVRPRPPRAVTATAGSLVPWSVSVMPAVRSVAPALVTTETGCANAAGESIC